MRKITTYFLFLVAFYFSSAAMAIECTDLNGVWHGQLDGVTVKLNINMSGPSSVDYRVAGGGGIVGGIRSACKIKEGVPNLEIWHQVNNERGTDWFIRIIVDGHLNNTNELNIKNFMYLNRSGNSASGRGILYKK